MADITMCEGYECTMKETCYRYKAPVNIHRQSYFSDAPHREEVDRDNNTICDHYWKVDKLGGYKSGIPLGLPDLEKP
jgi:hypothetical protein